MSMDLESSIAVASLNDGKALDTALAQINVDHFEDERTRLVMQACRDLRGQGKAADVAMVCDELERRGHALLTFVADLVLNGTGVAANIQGYIDRWKARQQARMVRQIGFELVAKAAENIDEAVANALQALATLKSGSEASGPVDIKTTLSRTIAKIQERMLSHESYCLPSGFPEFDDMVGMEPGDLVIVAGRPAMGKTAFAMNVAEHVAQRQGKGVLAVSLEMGDTQLGMRMISSLGGVNVKSLRRAQLTDEDLDNMNTAIGRLHQTKLFIDERANTVPMLAAAARRIRAQHGLALIVVDYIQLMSGENRENRTQEVSAITRGLKLLAKELHVPIIALSQLSRACEERSNKRPGLHDLRESGSIEQDADIVVMVYRDDYYNPQTPNKGIGELIVAKARMGETGTVYAKFEGQYSRYRPVTREQAAQIAQANVVDYKPMRRQGSNL